MTCVRQQEIHSSTNDRLSICVCQFIRGKPVIKSSQLRRVPIEGNIILRLDDGSFVKVGVVSHAQDTKRGNEGAGIRRHMQFHFVCSYISGLIVNQNAVLTGYVLQAIDSQSTKIRGEN